MLAASNVLRCLRGRGSARAFTPAVAPGSVRWVLQGRDQRHETHDWDGVEVFEPSIGRGVEMVDRLNSGVGFEHSSQRSSVS